MFASIRRSAFATLLAGVAIVASCGNDPTEPEDPADDLHTIRLTIGSQTVNLTGGGSASVTLPLGNTNVSTTFLDEDGATLTIPSTEFELRFEDDTGRVTFTRTGPFAGTLTGGSAGTTTVQVFLWHLEEDHDDFEAMLNVTVQ